MEILVPLAQGFEEIEAVTVIDVLRRAGMNVVIAGLPGSQVRGSRGLQVTTDKRLEQVDPSKFDAIVLVGGNPGYINLGRSNKILDIVVKFNLDKKLIGAICAAPAISCGRQKVAIRRIRLPDLLSHEYVAVQRRGTRNRDPAQSEISAAPRRGSPSDAGTSGPVTGR